MLTQEEETGAQPLEGPGPATQRYEEELANHRALLRLVLEAHRDGITEEEMLDDALTSPTEDVDVLTASAMWFEDIQEYVFTNINEGPAVDVPTAARRRRASDRTPTGLPRRKNPPRKK